MGIRTRPWAYPLRRSHLARAGERWGWNMAHGPFSMCRTSRARVSGGLAESGPWTSLGSHLARAGERWGLSMGARTKFVCVAPRARGGAVGKRPMGHIPAVTMEHLARAGERWDGARPCSVEQGGNTSRARVSGGH